MTSKLDELHEMLDTMTPYRRAVTLRRMSIQQSAAENGGIPIIPAENSPSGLRFWCPWCEKHHFHGGDGGHRVSHCPVEDSPLKDGYILKPVQRLEPSPTPAEGERRSPARHRGQ